MTDTMIDRVIANIRRLVYRDAWDFPITIEGAEGSGKSTLGLQLMRKLDETFARDLMNAKTRDAILRERVLYTGPDFLRAFTELKPGSVAMLDEAYALYASTEFMSERNRMIDKTLTEIRSLRKIPIFITPQIGMLGIGARRRTQMLFHCLATTRDSRRGRAEVFVPYVDKFGRYKTPRWDALVGDSYILEYARLPDDIYEAYDRAKSEALSQRHERRIVESEEQDAKGIPAFQRARELLDKTRARDARDRDRLRGSRGRFDRDKISVIEGVPRDVAGMVAGVLNDEFPATKSKTSKTKKE